MVFVRNFLLQQLKERPNLKNVKNPRNYRLIAAFVVFLGASFGPIYIYPLYNSKAYQEIQEKGRAGISQEDIQPGGMRVWSDPFAPLPDKDQKKGE
uniref:small integral membrane protein 20-like n=1 Tax=Styela clava TaxID=7725 RepID=UPI00193AD421|nr:small integral membrane protein 20-like [Styela clava]